MNYQMGGAGSYTQQHRGPNILSRNQSQLATFEAARAQEARLARLKMLQKEMDDAKMRSVSREMGT